MVNGEDTSRRIPIDSIHGLGQRRASESKRLCVVGRKRITPVEVECERVKRAGVDDRAR